MTYRSTWCEVDLNQFRQNIRILKQVAGTKMLQVVKANAYGHGLVRMSHEVVAAGADMVGVATIGEAEQLLDSKISVPVLIITPTDPEEIEWSVAHGVHFLAWRTDQFECALEVAAKYERVPLIHLEVDVGMARSGLSFSEFPGFVASMTPAMKSAVVAIAAHFYSAAMEDLAPAYRALDGFMECARVAEQYELRPLLHIANSTGTIRIPEARLGMVRMGVTGYGLSPSKFAVIPEGVAPVMTWMAKVTNVKHVEPGVGVSYAWEYVADQPHRVATLGIGYADNFHRHPPGVNRVLLGGVEVPVLGRVCMDQCIARIPDNLDVNVGDTAVIIGSQGNASITAADIALRWGTNTYDVVAGIRNRVPRIYNG